MDTPPPPPHVLEEEVRELTPTAFPQQRDLSLSQEAPGRGSRQA